MEDDLLADEVGHPKVDVAVEIVTIAVLELLRSRLQWRYSRVVPLPGVRRALGLEQEVHQLLSLERRVRHRDRPNASEAALR
jgi:hypothetical protein